MIPDPAEITRRRVTAVTLIRVLTMLPFLIAVGFAASWVNDIVTDRLYAEEHTAYFFVILIFLGAVALMWGIAPWHARRAVRMPKKVECPACRYTLEGLTEARCPECGLALTSEFVAAPGEKNPPPREVDRVMLRQLATTLVRLLGVIGVVVTVPITIAMGIELLQSMNSGYYSQDDLRYYPLAGVGTTFVFSVLLIAISKPLSGFIVPRRAAFAADAAAQAAAEAPADPAP